MQTATVLPDESRFFPVELRVQGQQDVVVWCSGVSIDADTVRFENGRAVAFGFTDRPEGVASMDRTKIVGEITIHPPS